MLMNLHKKGWTEGLKLEQFDELRHKNEGAVKVRTAFDASFSGLPADGHHTSRFTGDAFARRGLHRFGQRGVDDDAPAARNEARRQARPEAAPRGRGREGDGRRRRPELGHGRPRRALIGPPEIMHITHHRVQYRFQTHAR